MPTINIEVNGHSVTSDGIFKLASGSNKYDRLKFTFDDSWNSLTKYASLSRDMKKFTRLALDANGECSIESTQISNEGDLYIGAYGEGSGSLKATTCMLRVAINAGSVKGIIPLTEEDVSTIMSELASFREDLSALNRDLSNLSEEVFYDSDFDLIEGHSGATYPYAFRTGYYDMTDGSAKSSSHHLRSTTNYVFDESVKRLKIVAPSGLGVMISEYDTSGAYVRKVGSIVMGQIEGVAEIEVTAGYIYKISLGYYTSSITNDTITEQMIKAFESFTIKSVIEKQASDIDLLKNQIKDDKNIAIKYQSGSYASGKATERLLVYLKDKLGYMKYTLYHFVDSDINCDGWQIYHVYHVDDLNDTNQIDLTITGEWECAIHLKDRDDFSGGHTHGDEVMTSFLAFVDGKKVDISTFTALTEVESLRLVCATKMYDPSNHSREIAEHGKEWNFKANKLVLNQSLKWLVEEELTNCFLTMFTPSKSYTNRAYVNSEFKEEILNESNYSYSKPNASGVSIYNANGGFSANVYTSDYPSGLVGGDRMSLSDNGGLAYNKCYWKVCGEGETSEVGEIWKSSTTFILDYV